MPNSQYQHGSQQLQVKCPECDTGFQVNPRYYEQSYVSVAHQCPLTNNGEKCPGLYCAWTCEGCHNGAVSWLENNDLKNLSSIKCLRCGKAPEIGRPTSRRIAQGREPDTADVYLLDDGASEEKSRRGGLSEERMAEILRTLRNRVEELNTSLEDLKDAIDAEALHNIIQAIRLNSDDTWGAVKRRLLPLLTAYEKFVGEEGVRIWGDGLEAWKPTPEGKFLQGVPIGLVKGLARFFREDKKILLGRGTKQGGGSAVWKDIPSGVQHELHQLRQALLGQTGEADERDWNNIKQGVRQELNQLEDRLENTLKNILKKELSSRRNDRGSSTRSPPSSAESQGLKCEDDERTALDVTMREFLDRLADSQIRLLDNLPKLFDLVDNRLKNWKESISAGDHVDEVHGEGKVLQELEDLILEWQKDNHFIRFPQDQDNAKYDGQRYVSAGTEPTQDFERHQQVCKVYRYGYLFRDVRGEEHVLQKAEAVFYEYREKGEPSAT